MKKILIFSFVVTLFSFVISCSKDNNEDLSLQKNELKKATNPVENFLSSKLSNYTVVDEYLLKSNNSKISFVKSSDNSHLYYVFYDLSTKKISLFINIDKANGSCAVDDFIKDKHSVSKDFFVRNNIKDKESFNLLDIIKQNSNSKRKFWGWDCWIDNCFWVCCHYVFWVETTCEHEPLCDW